MVRVSSQAGGAHDAMMKPGCQHAGGARALDVMNDVMWGTCPQTLM